MIKGQKQVSDATVNYCDRVFWRDSDLHVYFLYGNQIMQGVSKRHPAELWKFP